MKDKLRLLAVDFDEQTITLDVPHHLLNKGWKKGWCEIDLSDVIVEEKDLFEQGRVK